ncbi:hypothetical protein [uncultured Dokdonia sp.]|uniref:hypothetical protein n=1 Tax=Dokdonia sp. R78006 TaxID=3093866 RepID=UPI0026024790|nr:hypothetical protein [uncultured Dokdonia sp.]
MLKSILNLEGAQGLTKNEQKTINGGTGTQYSCESAGGNWECWEDPNSTPLGSSNDRCYCVGGSGTTGPKQHPDGTTIME